MAGYGHVQYMLRNFDKPQGFGDSNLNCVRLDPKYAAQCYLRNQLVSTYEEFMTNLSQQQSQLQKQQEASSLMGAKTLQADRILNSRSTLVATDAVDNNSRNSRLSGGPTSKGATCIYSPSGY